MSHLYQIVFLAYEDIIVIFISNRQNSLYHSVLKTSFQSGDVCALARSSAIKYCHKL